MTIIDRVGIRFHDAGGLIGSLIACAMLVAPVQAQESVDDAWFAWLGCWQAVGGPAGALGDANDVCIAPSEGPVGIDLLTVSDDRITATRTLVADGEQRAIEESGCSGWERSSWSADRQRVYLRSELECEGGTQRVTSGVIAMTSPIEWLEVQTVEAGGYPVVRTQRYRQAPASVAEAVGLASVQDRALALETARTAASEPIGVQDLAEASRELSPEALELFLYELGGTFDVNAESLVAMADAGVPESTIDLVVALAHPDVFNVNSEARLVGYRPDEATPADARDPDRYGRRVYGRFYDPYYYDPFAYGYSSGYGYGYSPFGWGGGYGWRSTGGQVIIVEPRDREPQERGRLVKGRGYTRGGAATTETRSSSSRGARERVGTSSSSTRRSSATTRSTSSSRGSSKASTGSSSGSSGRKAKRKGGGGGV